MTVVAAVALALAVWPVGVGAAYEDVAVADGGPTATRAAFDII